MIHEAPSTGNYNAVYEPAWDIEDLLEVCFHTGGGGFYFFYNNNMQIRQMHELSMRERHWRQKMKVSAAI